MKKKVGDAEWTKLAEKNAKHSAQIHLESGNSQKIAEAFKDIDPTTALEFLYKLAEKARLENKSKRAMVILEAVAMIDRKTGMETDVTLEETITEGKKHVQVSIRRFSPAEIFASPIMYEEVEDFPEPKEISK